MALIFSPGPVARRLLPRLHPGGGSLSAAAVGGDLLRGIVLEDVRYERPGLTARARRVRLRPSWHGLLRRHLAIERLVVESPRLRVEPERLAPWPAPGGWTVSVRRLSLEDGSLEVASPSGTRRVDAVAARGSVRRGTLALESASARVPGLSVTVRGRVSAGATTLDAALAGETTGQVRLEGASRRWRVEGRGRWRGARWVGWASFEDGRWGGRASLAGLEPRRLTADPRVPAAPLSFWARGAGRGLSPATAEASLTLRAEQRGGPAADARVALSSGTARFQAALSSGASGTAAGTARLLDRTFEARWRLTGDALPRRLGLSAASLRAEGTAAGRWPDARWTAKVLARGARYGEWRANAASLSASGTRSRVEARLRLAHGRAGGMSLDRADARVAGTAAGHAVSFDVDTGTIAVSARGRGSLRGGVWTARWASLALSKPRLMRSERPFATVAGRGRLAISGLELSGERDSRLELSARKEGDSWPAFTARARFDLQTLYETGLVTTPASGRVEVALDLSGDLRAPSGRAAFDISRGRIADIDVGSATVRVSLDGRLASIERFDWQLGRGRAVLTGEVPLKLHDPRPPDFALRVQAQRLSLAPFARHLTAVALTKPRLDADLTLRRSSGRWSLSGGGRADVETAAVPSAGLALGASRVEFSARGERLELTRSSLAVSGKGAKAALSGALTPDGPQVRLTGERLRSDTGRGLTAEADADVAIVGTWEAPAVTGTVRVRRADFTPLTAKQKKRIDEQQQREAAADPPRPSPGSLDLRLLFDGNAWYREHATAIEMKGDVRVRKKPFEPVQLLGTVDTVRGDYVYFSRVFKVESGSLKLAGETPLDAVVAARGLYVDDATRTKIHLALTGTLAEPKLQLTSEPPMEERDIVSYLVTGQPLYEVGGVEGKKVGGTAEAASVIADYMSQGLRRYLPPRLALDVFRLEVQRGSPGVTVGRYVTRRLFVSYGQTAGAEGGRKVDATYTLSPHWSVETQNTNQRAGATTSGTTGTSDTIVDILFNFGFR